MWNKQISPTLKKLFKGKGSNAFTAALLSIAFGLIFGFIVMLIASPAESWYGFITMLFGGMSTMGDVFYFATPILMTGLSVGFAFKMGLFNIGASGQYTMGMFFALYAAFMFDVPDSMRWIVGILAGMVGGMLWGFIPGILKALANVNEVITSIMFNYIGMFLVDMMIMKNSTMYISTKTRTQYLPESAKIPTLGVPNSAVNYSIIFAVLIAVILYIILNKTTFGYELKATGFNKHASKYAGMNDKRNTILTMLIAGGLAGLGGAFNYLAPSTIAGSCVQYEPINIIAANGFNGIAVALLGASNPIGIIFSALFISYIQRGGTQVSIFFGYKPEIIDVVISVIIYFSAFAMLINAGVARMIKKRKQEKEEKMSIAASAAAAEKQKDTLEDTKADDVSSEETGKSGSVVTDAAVTEAEDSFTDNTAGNSEVGDGREEA